MLHRIAATLFALAALCHRLTFYPRPIARLVLWILRPAEATARRFVTDFARGCGFVVNFASTNNRDALQARRRDGADSHLLGQRFRALAEALEDLLDYAGYHAAIALTQCFRRRRIAPCGAYLPPGGGGRAAGAGGGARGPPASSNLRHPPASGRCTGLSPLTTVIPGRAEAKSPESSDGNLTLRAGCMSGASVANCRLPSLDSGFRSRSPGMTEVERQRPVQPRQSRNEPSPSTSSELGESPSPDHGSVWFTRDP